VKSSFIAVALAAICTPAFAGATLTAAPATPSTKQGFVGGSVIWSCDNSGCRSTSDTTGADTLSACRGLAAQVGALTVFAVNGQAVTAVRLAACNTAAKKPK
jgi:hypothetical protein